MTDAPIVLSIYDLTGMMVLPWLEDGYECWTVDYQHPKGETRIPEAAGPGTGTLVRVGADLRRGWLPPRREYAAAFSFTPCDNMAVSGARWFKDKGLAGLAAGIELAERGAEILQWTEAPGFQENPVSTLATYWRKPDYYLDPWQYGGYLLPGDPQRPGFWPQGNEHYTKKTCLWTFGGFVMPPTHVPQELAHVEPDNRIHTMPPSPERANWRSATPLGFARAVKMYNCRRDRLAIAV